MSNQKLYIKVLKFKDLDNKSYEVDIKDNDLVIDIKKKLSRKIKKYHRNVLLIFKNKLLFDDKLISDYKIELNQFVLWFEGDDCVKYSHGDSDIIKCITIIDNYNNDEYFVNINKSSTVGMLKSKIASKYELNKQFYLEFNNLSTAMDATIEQCGMHDGCIIYLVKLNRDVCLRMERYTKNITCKDGDHRRCPMICYLDISVDDLSLISLTNIYESFTARFIFDFNDLIMKIRSKNNIYDSIIDYSDVNLYSDVDKINEIKNDRDLRNLYENTFHGNKIEIHYEIITELDKLEKIEMLGQGSYGTVYKYRNKNTKQIFALKKFDFSTKLFIKDKFQREVDCYCKLKSHPRIIKYEKHFIIINKSYILMEYMDRGSLGRFVQHNDLLPKLRIAKYARQILEGLEYLHKNRILHRDLKGDNILLNENDDLKLCDFGLAKILTEISSGDFLNGVVQSTLGTANWQSPEILSDEECGPASDIWSFGATMVEIITRKIPHFGLKFVEIVSNILAGKIKFYYPANSSDDLKSFINSCLKRNPKERASIKDLYQSGFLKKSL